MIKEGRMFLRGMIIRYLEFKVLDMKLLFRTCRRSRRWINLDLRSQNQVYLRVKCRSKFQNWISIKNHSRVY